MGRQKKLDLPFMVFSESVPEAAQLHDPKTPASEKARIRTAIKSHVDVVKVVAERNTQRARHMDNHAKRDKILAALRRDARGKPLRGEPKRLASAHNVSVRTVEKWILQIGSVPTNVSDAAYDDWRTVYHGQAISHQNSNAARRRKKRGN